MSAARDQMEYLVSRGSADEVELREGIADLDAYRAQVLREAADVAAPEPDTCGCGGCGGCTAQQIAAELHRRADAIEGGVR